VLGRLSRKLLHQLNDPGALASGALPEWAEVLAHRCSFLFPLQVRRTLLEATAFGVDRSIAFLQSRQEEVLAAGGMPPSAMASLRLGTLRRERASVSRARLLVEADALFAAHARRRTVLEVVFRGEGGSGLGVTSEFYSRVAEELCLVAENDRVPCWLPNEEGAKGRSTLGVLFPRPLPPGDPSAPAVAARLRFLGRFVGKVLLDRHVVSLPLSPQFLALVLGHALPASALAVVFPGMRQVLTPLLTYCEQRHTIATDAGLSEAERESALKALRLPDGGDVEDALLTFVSPITGTPLCEGGEERDVRAENVEEFMSLLSEWLLDRSVRVQVEAFREGLSEVIPWRRLRMFSPQEVRYLLCGDEEVTWDEQSLLEHLLPEHGYTTDSPTIRFLVDVLVELPTRRRREFLQFCTGCPHLPPGGLAQLQPPLKVNLKDVHPADAALPSARTCFHQVHLPPYSSRAILRERLLFAISNSKGLIDFT